MMNLFLQMQQQATPDDGGMLNQTSNQLADSAQNIGAWLGLTGPALSIVGGILLLIVGYFISKFIGNLVTKLLRKTGVDDKTEGDTSISKFGGKLVYYLLMIIVLMATLSMMGVSGDVLAPLNIMTTKFFGAIPNIVAAGVIAYVGYFLAKIVSGLVEASGDKIRSWIPKVSKKASTKEYLGDDVEEINNDISNVTEETKGFDIVKVLKNIVFIFVFVPILVIALDKLDMYAVTHPLTEMLSSFINAIPNIVYAAIILLVAIIGGKLLTQLLKNLLVGLNVNDLSRKLHLQDILGKVNFVELIGNVVYIFIVYMGVIEAANHLGLDQAVYVLDEVLNVAGKIVFGLIILAIGNAVANFVSKIFFNKNNNKLLATIMKAVILVLFLAMGLKAMGIADSIVELAFGLGLGALAVAFALSFGLGGREAAGEEVKDFFKRLRNKNNNNLTK